MKSDKLKKYNSVLNFKFQHTVRLKKMSQVERLVSVKGKPLFLCESYIYVVERTTKTKSILRYQNRDCKGKTALITDQLTQIKIIHQ